MASALDTAAAAQREVPVRGSQSGVRPAVQGTMEALRFPFQHGEVIGAKYKIIRLIGSGGMGFVVSARHIGFDEIVALKFLRPEYSTHSEAVTRFTIEARASFKIKSEHVARVIDVDSLPDGTPFIAMELLEGTDLRRLLDRCRVLPIRTAVDYVLQTCEALASAHAQHIIHRDIKPENLFLTGQGNPTDRVKVLDFGISKVALAGPQRQTQQALTQVAVGTPPYMAPEQVRASSDLDARADIWSVGCVLYEFLTGTAPFDRMSLMQSCAAVLEEEPVPPRDLRLPIPVELDAIVMRCLQKDPQQRYQDVAELANALAPFASEALQDYPQRCRTHLSCESTGRRPTMTSSIKGAATLPAPVNPANSVGLSGRQALQQSMANSSRVAASEFADSVQAGDVADLATTRPTLLLSDVLAPEPRTRLLPLSLSLGAALAFAGAYVLSHNHHANPKRPTAALSKSSQAASAAPVVSQPNLTPITAPALPVQAVGVVAPPIAASTELPPRAAGEAPSSAKLGRTAAVATARKLKTKLRSVTRKSARSADEPDVGF